MPYHGSSDDCKPTQLTYLLAHMSGPFLNVATINTQEFSFQQ